MPSMKRLSLTALSVVLLAGCTQSVTVRDYVGEDLEAMRADLPTSIDTTIVIDLTEVLLPDLADHTSEDDDQWTIGAQCSSGADWPVGRPVVVGVLPTTTVTEQLSMDADDGDFRDLLQCEKNEWQPSAQ